MLMLSWGRIFGISSCALFFLFFFLTRIAGQGRSDRPKAYIRLYTLTCIVDLRRMYFFFKPFSLWFSFLVSSLIYAIYRQRLWRKSVSGASRCVSRDNFSISFFFPFARILSKTGSRVIKSPFLFSRFFFFSLWLCIRLCALFLYLSLSFSP